MANKKMIRSQSNVPFSWEEKPGISKFSSNNNYTGQNAIIGRPLQILPSLSSYSYTNSPSLINTLNLKISPPPCGGGGGGVHHQTPSRSNSLTKGLIWWRQDDPFVAAMKECTKNIKHYGLPSSSDHQRKICIGNSSNIGRNKKTVFSCKKSSACDVLEGNLVRLPSTKLPPLPLSQERKKKLSCMAKVI